MHLLFLGERKGSRSGFPALGCSLTLSPFLPLLQECGLIGGRVYWPLAQGGAILRLAGFRNRAFLWAVSNLRLQWVGRKPSLDPQTGARRGGSFRPCLFLHVSGWGWGRDGELERGHHTDAHLIGSGRTERCLDVKTDILYPCLKAVSAWGALRQPLFHAQLGPT